MAPVFDHNQCLFSDLDNEQLQKPEWFIKKCRPRLGKDFALTAQNLLTDEIRSDLSRLREFSFTQHHTIKAEPERLSALGLIVRLQADNLLSV